MQTVGEECDENVGFDSVLVLMEYGAYRQILLQVFECLFHGNELDIVLPQQCGIVLGEIGAQQITPFAAASTSQLLTVECVGERGAFLVHLDIDQAPCGGCFSPCGTELHQHLFAGDFHASQLS